MGKLAEVGEPVVVEEASLDAVLGDDGDAATSAGTAVAVDGQRHALLDLGEGLEVLLKFRFTLEMLSVQSKNLLMHKNRLL